MPKLCPNAMFSACYSLTGSDQDWLLHLTRTLRPWLDRGFGVGAVPFSVHGAKGVRTVPAIGLAELGQTLFDLGTRAPTPLARRFFIGARTGSACERIGHAAGLDRHPQLTGFAELGIRDIDALTVRDRAGFGLAVLAPAPRVLVSSRPALQRLSLLGRHVLAGLRLRKLLGRAEAVIDSAGRVLHAEGEARAAHHRAALREAVKALERMRHPASSQDDERAFDAWQALVHGRWSLVETFESDGRRFLVARRNAAVETRRGSLAAFSGSGLSELEADALTRRAAGASYKVVASELELSLASAHRLVQAGLRKLGIRNDAELPLFLDACARAALRS